MDHLETISVERLQDALDNVEGKTPGLRLLAAIAYKHSVTQTELARWYGVERKTIYNWLTRLDTDESLEQAVTDANRSGRPRKLPETDQDAFEKTLQNEPREVGYDAPAWTPELVQRHLKERYDVTYSIPSCRRLLNETGVH